MLDLLNINDLEKGDVLEPDVVLQVMGIDPEEADDSAMPADVRLAGLIEREMHRSGQYWTVKAWKGAVYILTDAEAYEHNRKRQRSGYRKFKRAVTGMSGVDVTRFSDEKRQEFDLDSRKLTAQYMALKNAKVTPMELLQPAKVGR